MKEDQPNRPPKALNIISVSNVKEKNIQEAIDDLTKEIKKRGGAVKSSYVNLNEEPIYTVTLEYVPAP